MAGTLVGAPLLASDPEGDTLTFALVSQPASGNFYACSSDGQLSVAAGQTLPAISGGISTHTLVVVSLIQPCAVCGCRWLLTIVPVAPISLQSVSDGTSTVTSDVEVPPTYQSTLRPMQAPQHL